MKSEINCTMSEGELTYNLLAQRIVPQEDLEVMIDVRVKREDEQDLKDLYYRVKSVLNNVIQQEWHLAPKQPREEAPDESYNHIQASTRVPLADCRSLEQRMLKASSRMIRLNNLQIINRIAPDAWQTTYQELNSEVLSRCLTIAQELERTTGLKWQIEGRESAKAASPLVGEITVEQTMGNNPLDYAAAIDTLIDHGVGVDKGHANGNNDWGYTGFQIISLMSSVTLRTVRDT